MIALEIIDLHQNFLTGPVPDFLGNLSNLKILNLADNNFTGNIPDSLANNKRLSLNITQNPDLHLNGNRSSPNNTDNPDLYLNRKSKKATVGGSIGGGIGFSILSFTLYKGYRWIC
ncbi:uncharacterized protein LOC143878700 [Tasmannia lanceolata]